MRALPVAVVSILVGSVVGVVSAYRTVGPQRSASDIAAIRSGEEPTAVNYPMFAADSTSYDFGVMQRGTSREHAFQVTNEGTQPLKVEVTSTTCKCTVGEEGVTTIPPGDTADVTLSWVAKTVPGTFRQTATLATNDPRARRVELTVEGQVTDVSGIEPQQWFFDKLRAGDRPTESVYVMAFANDDLAIDSAVLEHEDARGEYQVEVVPVPKDDLPDANAKSGFRIDVTPQQGLGLGPIHDWVLLKTNIEGAEELRVPIMGSVVGDIEIRGPSAWNDVTSAVHFGDVQSQEGAEVKLFLSVGGDRATDTTFEVAEVDPDSLEIEIGEPKTLRPDLVHVPLTVRLPKGLPPAIRNGTGMGEAARVVLKTSDPVNPELSFGVRYVIKRPSITK